MNHLTNGFFVKLVTYSAISLLTWTLQYILSLTVSHQQTMREEKLFTKLQDFIKSIWTKTKQNETDRLYLLLCLWCKFIDWFSFFYTHGSQQKNQSQISSSSRFSQTSLTTNNDFLHKLSHGLCSWAAGPLSLCLLQGLTKRTYSQINIYWLGEWC